MPRSWRTQHGAGGREDNRQRIVGAWRRRRLHDGQSHLRLCLVGGHGPSRLKAGDRGV